MDAKSAAIQPLLGDIPILSLTTAVSNLDKIVDFLVSEFNVPIEVVDIVFSYISILYLDVFGASFDQIMHYSNKATFESVKQELKTIFGFKINHDGQV